LRTRDAARQTRFVSRFKENLVKIAVERQPEGHAPPEVEYRWDADTDILSAQLSPRAVGDGISGSVGLEGTDGSWLILDVAAGRINGVEVAVWPDVRKLPVLNPPGQVEDAHVVVPPRPSKNDDIASLEMDTRVIAEADHDERTFHFRLGKPRNARTVRLARNLLVDVDDKSRISGLWLLNVPPCPTES
jgi:hypothetical protein